LLRIIATTVIEVDSTVWQNFQETALSLELSDILDTPQELDEAGRRNIPMPDIRGAGSGECSVTVAQSS